jgi:hypothetical protein
MINKTATDINHTMETQSQVTLSVYKDSPIPYALSISYVVVHIVDSICMISLPYIFMFIGRPSHKK